MYFFLYSCERRRYRDISFFWHFSFDEPNESAKFIYWSYTRLTLLSLSLSLFSLSLSLSFSFCPYSRQVTRSNFLNAVHYIDYRVRGGKGGKRGKGREGKGREEKGRGGKGRIGETRPSGYWDKGMKGWRDAGYSIMNKGTMIKFTCVFVTHLCFITTTCWLELWLYKYYYYYYYYYYY